MRRASLVLIVAAGCARDTSRPIANATSRSPTPSARCGRDDLKAPPLDATPEGRLRKQVSGPLDGEVGRTWEGAPVPDYIPAKLGTLELFLVDVADGGHLAFYRAPYDTGSCRLSGVENCAYRVQFYDGRGELAWDLALNDFMSRNEHLEVQDIRLSNDVLYFNEACQGFSSGTHGTCSSLVALDPRAREVLWRTPPMISNGRFRLRGCYIIAGFGFTEERDWLFLVDRATGAVRQKLALPSEPQELTLEAPDQLVVRLYPERTRRFRLDGMDGKNGTITALDADPEGIGARYGGMTYRQLTSP